VTWTKPETSLAAKPIIAIGDYCFQLVSCNQELIERTAEAFLLAPDPSRQFCIIDLDLANEFAEEGQPEITDHPSSAIKRTITTGLKAHQSHILFDACCLLAPPERPVLLIGSSRLGKTTLTVAAALGLNWKIVAEDLTFIDTEGQRIIPFVLPLSLRRGAAEQIQAATGRQPIPVMYNRWLVAPDLFYGRPVASKFAAVIVLEQTTVNSQAPFQTRQLTAPELIRKLVSYGNFPRYPEKVDAIFESFAHEECSRWSFSGGSVSERLKAMAETVGFSDFGFSE